jgi:hypothetical protein
MSGGCIDGGKAVTHLISGLYIEIYMDIVLYIEWDANAGIVYTSLLCEAVSW